MTHPSADFLVDTRTYEIERRCDKGRRTDHMYAAHALRIRGVREVDRSPHRIRGGGDACRERGANVRRLRHAMTKGLYN